MPKRENSLIPFQLNSNIFPHRNHLTPETCFSSFEFNPMIYDDHGGTIFRGQQATPLMMMIIMANSIIIHAAQGCKQ